MIVRPVLASLAVLMIAASVGCGVGAGSERIDLPAFRASVAKSTGLDLVREPLGPEKREIPGLVARYTGIAPSERERIFRPFWSRGGGGTGLGLPIARELAAALGGRISLESSAEQGSRFELMLPTRPR